MIDQTRAISSGYEQFSYYTFFCLILDACSCSPPPYPPWFSTPLSHANPSPSLWAQTPAVKIKIHGYPCRMQLGRGCILTGRNKGEEVAQGSLWSAVPNAPLTSFNFVMLR